jgi:hypothetical protein
VTLKFQSSNQYKASTEPGLNEEILATQADHTEGADIPFLTALVETKGLMAVFSGHDHAVDWYTPTLLHVLFTRRLLSFPFPYLEITVDTSRRFADHSMCQVHEIFRYKSHYWCHSTHWK